MNSKQISTRHAFTPQIFGKAKVLPAADTRRIPGDHRKNRLVNAYDRAPTLLPSRLATASKPPSEFYD
jgi:hypothetical protein